MEKLDTDIVVVGSGAAGMAAALTAAENGARVMVFEKLRALGGISIFPAETFAVESRLQRRQNIPLSKDDAFKLIMDATQWRTDARLVRAFIDKTASTIDWLENHGIEFEINSYYVYPESHLAGHVVKLPGHFGGMLKILRSKAEGQGVVIKLSTHVRKLIKNGGRITGVIVEAISGESVQVDAKAVIIASGGYPDNKEMVKQFGGFELGEDLAVLSPIKLTGDGIKMAWEAGAASDGTAIALRYDIPSQKGHAHRWNLSLIGHQPYLWVNQQGIRFFDEGTAASGAYTANALTRQTNKCGYLIFDEETKKYLETEGWDNPMGFDSGICTDIDGLLSEFVGKEDSHIFIENSISSLGQKIGVDPDILQKTIDEYNLFCEKGHDDLFAKNRKYLKPVNRARYYAFRIMPMAYGTVGGIKINERAEVISVNDEVIPGLYAAGDCANGPLSHNFWLSFTLRGCPSSFALNTGRIAGENSSQYAGE